MKKLMAVAAISLIAFTSACGAGRPSVDDLSSAIQEQGDSLGITEEAADCIAEKVEASDISDDTLNKIVDGDVDVTGVASVPQDDADALDAITEDLATCISE
ncbi:hypothetical protein [Aeromicrobium sp. Leaf350]|uniref:hypothetical protein n=1 Tax=Aeromicrobium sp. Leaf350 TaxID=2876565 RepID=UPI001E3924D2|nr:hypothetical protein [Aeromicrobium sp. Leaf350]